MARINAVGTSTKPRLIMDRCINCAGSAVWVPHLATRNRKWGTPSELQDSLMVLLEGCWDRVHCRMNIWCCLTQAYVVKCHKTLSVCVCVLHGPHILTLGHRFKLHNVNCECVINVRNNLPENINITILIGRSFSHGVKLVTLSKSLQLSH